MAIVGERQTWYGLEEQPYEPVSQLNDNPYDPGVLEQCKQLWLAVVHARYDLFGYQRHLVATQGAVVRELCHSPLQVDLLLRGGEADIDSHFLRAQGL